MSYIKAFIVFGMISFGFTKDVHTFLRATLPNLKSDTYNCAVNIAKTYFNDKYPIEVMTANGYDSDVVQYIFDRYFTTIIIRKLDATHARRQSVKKYILEIKNVAELRILAEPVDVFWKPAGKFIIILKEEQPNLDSVFKKLFKRYIINVVILTKDADTNSTNVYTYFPYANGSCGKPPFKSSFLASCNAGDIERKNMFPDKVKGSFTGCTVDVATHIFPPYTVHAPKNTSRRLIGIEGTMLEELSMIEKFKINYSVLKNSPDFGVIINDKTATGLMANLQNGQVDIVSGGYVLSNDRRALFDDINIDLQDSMAMLVPRALPIEKWKNIFLTFRYELFVLIFISYIIFSSLLYTSNKQSLLKCITFESLFNTFFICWGVLFCNAVGAVNVDNKKLRFIFLTWLGYCGFLGACYQSVLFSNLARTIYTHQIETHEDLYQSGLKLSVDKLEWVRMKNNRDPMVKMFKDRVTVVPTLAESVSLVTKDKTHFILYTYSYYKSNPSSFTADDGHLLTFELSLKYNCYDVAMYTVKGFPHRPRFQTLFRRFHASGLTNKWREDVFVAEKPQLESINIQLTIYHLTGCFYILIIGMILSLIAFFLELRKYSS